MNQILIVPLSQELKSKGWLAHSKDKPKLSYPLISSLILGEAACRVMISI